MINFATLPEVPKAARPKKLFVRDTFDTDIEKALKKKGWELVDVRLMNDPGEAIKATFEGARMKTIDLGEEEREILLAEARLLGMMSSKQEREVKRESMAEEDLEQLKNFGKATISGAIRIIPRIGELEEIKVTRQKETSDD